MKPGWTEVALGEVCEIFSGFAFDSKHFSTSADSGIPLVRIRDVTRGRSETFYVGDYDPRFLVADGDVLIGMDGEFNRARWHGGPALLNQRVCRITALGDWVDGDYLFHFLPRALKEVEGATPFATVKHLSAKTIKQIAMPLPPLEEQQRIAAILDKADALQAKRRAAIAHLDSLAQAVFIDMFSHHEASGATRMPISEVAEVQGGLQVSRRRSSLPIEVPFLRVANVYRGRLALDEIKTMRATQAEVERTRLLEGDLLVVEGHGNASEIGRVARWTGEIDPCIHQNHLIRVRADRSVANPAYLETALNTGEGLRQLRQAGRTTSGLNTLSADDVRRTTVAIPAVDVQDEFAAVTARAKEERDRMIAADQATVALLAALHARAFRGEV